MTTIRTALVGLAGSAALLLAGDVHLDADGGG